MLHVCMRICCSHSLALQNFTRLFFSNFGSKITAIIFFVAHCDEQSLIHPVVKILG